MGWDATFILACVSLIAVFAGAGLPIPVLDAYRAAGLRTSDFAYASCAYFVAAAVGLLLFGRLSDLLGRKPVAATSLVIAAVGCAIMIAVDAAGWLIVARGFQGLACGVAPGALGAYIVDTAGQRRWLPALVTGSAPMIGLPGGALAGGALVELGGIDKNAMFATGAGALGVLSLALLTCREPVTRRRGVWATVKPRLALPLSARKEALTVAGIFVATWPLGGFYQAFGSIVAEDILGATDVLTAGLIFASIMLLNPLGGAIAPAVPARWGVAIGMSAYGACLVGATLALWNEKASLFVLASLLCGIAQGIAATCAMRLLIPVAAPQDRAGVVATIYFIAYLSVAVAGLAAGLGANLVDLKQIAAMYAALGLLATTLVVGSAILPEPRRSTTSKKAGH
ncbi:MULTISPECIES: MFS transporter [unclassified Aeromicrobium]|uniref:MFS transporter n=1 Tax=unclassified Aeromicrobium TaxID=2633570 RepID=UPI002889DF00|nr:MULTISPECIES: MFS transporter [unclassified Aeromicrobium]